MESIVREITFHIVTGIEAIAVVIVGIASVKALVKFFKSEAKPNKFDKFHIRIELGKSLVLALELLLGADILRTAVAPTWEEIGKLAAIATLRTILNYFLEREIDNAEDRDLSA